jgi:hypothetical protein
MAWSWTVSPASAGRTTQIQHIQHRNSFWSCITWCSRPFPSEWSWLTLSGFGLDLVSDLILCIVSYEWAQNVLSRRVCICSMQYIRIDYHRCVHIQTSVSPIGRGCPLSAPIVLMISPITQYVDTCFKTLEFRTITILRISEFHVPLRTPSTSTWDFRNMPP